MITGKNYIGSRLSAQGSKTFKTFDPIENKENEPDFFEANKEEIDEAVTLAQNAFLVYRSLHAKRKSEFLNEIANQIEVLGEELLEVYCQESGLPLGRAQGERGRTIGQLKSFANLVLEGSWVEASIDTAQPERLPVPKEDIRKMNHALGPVAVFGASNFPLAFSTAGGDTASALAAGCPVIVKSHPMHAGTSELVASAILKAAEITNMPEGVFSHLNSSGIEVGQQLAQHPGIKAIGFTGSFQGGKALFDLANQRKEPIPVFAEMGSLNPVVILPEALAQKSAHWAKVYAGSITLGSGQFCTNPGLILAVKSGGLDRFMYELSIEFIKIDPTCMLHPNIKRSYDQNKQKMENQSGLKTLATIDASLAPNVGRPAVTTIDGSDFLKNPQLHQEVFGPFSMVVQARDEGELEEILNQLEGQLTGTILGTPVELQDHLNLVEALRNKVGRIIFNGAPTGVEVCPSMNHGGPYPATTNARFTSVGTSAIQRWVRPVCYQNWPNNLLPEELQNKNPLGIMRLLNNQYSRDKI